MFFLQIQRLDDSMPGRSGDLSRQIVLPNGRENLNRNRAFQDLCAMFDCPGNAPAVPSFRFKDMVSDCQPYPAFDQVSCLFMRVGMLRQDAPCLHTEFREQGLFPED